MLRNRTHPRRSCRLKHRLRRLEARSHLSIPRVRRHKAMRSRLKLRCHWSIARCIRRIARSHRRRADGGRLKICLCRLKVRSHRSVARGHRLKAKSGRLKFRLCGLKVGSHWPVARSHRRESKTSKRITPREWRRNRGKRNASARIGIGVDSKCSGAACAGSFFGRKLGVVVGSGSVWSARVAVVSAIHDAS